MLRLTLLLMLGCAAFIGLAESSVSAPPSHFPPPKTLGPVETYGASIQRSMSLMATSTGLKRNTVRVLFYGQSITVQEWSHAVAERLRRQYPLADLIIENRAIGGYQSELLVKTAEADLFPFYPDLVVFHDYGDPKCYEEIIRRIRERTTADVLQATDHIAPLLGETLEEERDPAQAMRRNAVFLPAIAKRYDIDLADVRTLWRRYLIDHKLKPSALLSDDLHLNAHGNFLMAEIIGAHLRHRPDLPDNAWVDRVKTYTVGPEGDLDWKDGKLSLSFEGNKVDLVCRDGKAAPAPVRIDGKKPSEFPELYVPSRVEMVGAKVASPPVLRVQSESPRVLEEWTLKIVEIDAERKRFKFSVRGTVTGDDGEGESGQRFASKSGRVVIDADDIHLGHALLQSRNPGAREAVARWRVVPLFADEFAVPATRNPFGDTVVTVAQGLPNRKHTLEIAGSPDAPIAAIRVYRPPLPAK